MCFEMLACSYLVQKLEEDNENTIFFIYLSIIKQKFITEIRLRLLHSTKSFAGSNTVLPR